MEKRHLGRKTSWFTAAGIILVLVAFVLILSFFMRGETKVDGNWAVEQTSFLTCEIVGTGYPFFEYDNSYKKTIKINSTFNNDDIKTISLMYILEYNNEKNIIDSENLNHVAMNNNFAKDDLGFDALGLKFSKFSNGLQMSLFVNADQINNKTTKYFILDEVGFISPENMQKIYEIQGFICQRNINNKESK